MARSWERQKSRQARLRFAIAHVLLCACHDFWLPGARPSPPLLPLPAKAVSAAPPLKSATPRWTAAFAHDFASASLRPTLWPTAGSSAGAFGPPPRCTAVHMAERWRRMNQLQYKRPPRSTVVHSPAPATRCPISPCGIKARQLQCISQRQHKLLYLRAIGVYNIMLRGCWVRCSRSWEKNLALTGTRHPRCSVQ